MQELAYIALGSNLGDRLANLRAAITRLRELGSVVACSSVYETEPREFFKQPWFLNAVVGLAAALDPPALLQQLLHIELRMGRVRAAGEPAKGPRMIDLDLLLLGDAAIDRPGLHLPHPRLQDRLFVLTPLAEIAPDMVHPLLLRSLRELRDSLAGDENAGTVRLFAPPLC